jgi:HK97 family phage prohead protease
VTTTTAEPELRVPHRFDELQYRAADVEDIDLDEGMIVMRAAPYDVETMLDHELWESFAPKTFSRAANAPTRVKLWHEHQGPLIGHAKEVEDRPDGIWIRARFSNTPSALEARELASDGSLDQVSITFKPMREYMRVAQKPDGLHIRHSRGGLLGVALCAHGAYAENAFIASVRDADAARDLEARRAALLALDH